MPGCRHTRYGGLCNACMDERAADRHRQSRRDARDREDRRQAEALDRMVIDVERQARVDWERAMAEDSRRFAELRKDFEREQRERDEEEAVRLGVPVQEYVIRQRGERRAAKARTDAIRRQQEATRAAERQASMRPLWLGGAALALVLLLVALVVIPGWVWLAVVIGVVCWWRPKPGTLGRLVSTVSGDRRRR